MLNKKKKILTLSIAATLGLVGCASIENYTGTITGCLGGAAMGYLANGEQGAYYGAAVGCTAGYLWDRRQAQIREVAAAYDAAQATEIDKVSIPVKAGDKARLNAEIMSASYAKEQVFATSSAKLTAEGRDFYRNLALKTYADESNKLLIVGHADASGSASYNQRLSEQRAKAVARLLMSEGIAENRLYYQGAGESQPVADNNSPNGRTLNRRVEIVELKAGDNATPLQQEQMLASYSQKKQTDQRNILAYETAKPVKTKPSPPTSRLKPKVDFGGTQADMSSNFYELLGEPKKGLSFSLFETAYADDELSRRRNCLQDEPRVSGNLKRLSDNSSISYSTGDYMRGMNNAVWHDTVNGHIVALAPVAVLADASGVAATPKVKLYKNGYKTNSKPDYLIATDVNIYNGDDALLYRVFAKDSTAPFECMDIVLPKSGTAVARAGELFYGNGNQMLVATYQPKHIKRK